MTEDEFYPTKHVVEKMKSRNVTWGDILEVLEHPETIYGPDDQGRKNYQRGNLCVIAGNDKAVITVLLRQSNQWNDEEATHRNTNQGGNR